jgi:hypothetical protein
LLKKDVFDPEISSFIIATSSLSGTSTTLSCPPERASRINALLKILFEKGKLMLQLIFDCGRRILTAFKTG